MNWANCNIPRNLDSETLMSDLITACAVEILELCDEDPSLNLPLAMEKLEETIGFHTVNGAIVEKARTLDEQRNDPTAHWP